MGFRHEKLNDKWKILAWRRPKGDWRDEEEQTRPPVQAVFWRSGPQYAGFTLSQLLSKSDSSFAPGDRERAIEVLSGKRTL